MNHYTLLAKLAVENNVKEGKIINPPAGLPKEFSEKRAGVFVTIEKDNELRGCIGTCLPSRPTIAQEIIRNAVAAATKDSRFDPVEDEELPYLSYIVYILGDPEPIEETEELDPKKFGVIVKTAPIAFPNQEVVFDANVLLKSGLLLPDLDGIDTAEEQFSIACQKGQIDPAKEKVFIYRFTVEKY